MIEGIQCFNERKEGSAKNVFRPIEEKYDFSKGPVKSGSGKDMVIVVPFNCLVRVKAVILIGGDDGESPQTMKLYKNEEVVDIDIQEEKKPIQTHDLSNGEMEYLTNVAKFGSTSNLIIGVDGSFGANRSSLKFIGIKGDRLREKV